MILSVLGIQASYMTSIRNTTNIKFLVVINWKKVFCSDTQVLMCFAYSLYKIIVFETKSATVQNNENGVKWL